MKLGELFDNIILCAQEAKTLYELNAEVECFARLDEVVKTIGVLREFYEKYESLRTQSRIGAYPEFVDAQSKGRSRKGKRKSEEEGLDIRPKKKKSLEVLETEVSEQDVQNAFGEIEGMDKDIKLKLDRILLGFLEKVCSDENICDQSGNKIHLNFSERHKNSKTYKEGLYLPFRFRIHPLQAAFFEEMKRQAALPDDENLYKTVKDYLWTNRFIKRFNEENKKLKVKGNHIWMVEAANTIRGRWIFREYTRKYLTEPPQVAYYGQRFTYAPKVWDPEIADPQILFSTNHLPHWLSWSNNILSGTPDEAAEDVEIRILANIFPPGKGKKLKEAVRVIEQIAKIRVLRMDGQMHGVDPNQPNSPQNVDEHSLDHHQDQHNSLHISTHTSHSQHSHNSHTSHTSHSSHSSHTSHSSHSSHNSLNSHNPHPSHNSLSHPGISSRNLSLSQNSLAHTHNSHNNSLNSLAHSSLNSLSSLGALTVHHSHPHPHSHSHSHSHSHQHPDQQGHHLHHSHLHQQDSPENPIDDSSE